MVSMSGLDLSFFRNKLSPEPIEVLCVAPDGSEVWIDGETLLKPVKKKRGRPPKKVN